MIESLNRYLMKSCLKLMNLEYEDDDELMNREEELLKDEEPHE